MLDVALLFAGGLRGFDVDLAHKLSRNVLKPLSISTATLDMFACNEPGDHLRPESRRVIEESGVRLYELEAWSFSWLNPTDGGATQAHAFQWALRVARCYLAAARGVERRYDGPPTARPAGGRARRGQHVEHEQHLHANASLPVSSHAARTPGSHHPLRT